MTSISLALACPLYATSTDIATCEGSIWWDRQIGLPMPSGDRIYYSAIPQYHTGT
jgi:hypothetical protein